MAEATGLELEARFLAALRELGCSEHAAQEKRYHRSSWEHWGVRAPAMDRAIREHLQRADPDALFALCERLWREPVWDLKIVAARALARHSVAPDERAWRFIRERMPELDGWAIADNFADAGSRCLIADPRRLGVVETWVADPHLWTRRASLVFTLPWTKAGRDPEPMLGWASTLLKDREWFIQKAIGWWLRSLSKTAPERVRRFLAEHGDEVKGVARREAMKYLGRKPS
ncbi:MAG: DNA alkylation repair protein [Hyphomicrobiales bacterium]|nr:DNA alkylation repair protein [Hyphomicrobiales bacterium]